jgi:hypothetical protein
VKLFAVVVWENYLRIPQRGGTLVINFDEYSVRIDPEGEPEMKTVIVLFAEISDKMGTNEVVGVYSTVEAAECADTKIPRYRTFTKSFDLDAVPKSDRNILQ